MIAVAASCCWISALDVRAQEEEHEGDPETTKAMLAEVAAQEAASKKKIVTYDAEIPIGIKWFVKESLTKAYPGMEVETVNIIRESTDGWLVTTCRVEGNILYGAFKRPPDWIELIGFYKTLQGAVAAIPDPDGREAMVNSVATVLVSSCKTPSEKQEKLSQLEQTSDPDLAPITASVRGILAGESSGEN